MDEEFLTLCAVTGLNGDGPDGRCYDPYEMVQQMRGDAKFRLEMKSFLELTWRTVNRQKAEALITILVNSARYLSDVIGGEVPVLAPREVIDASLGICRADERDDLLVGKAMRRAVRSQLADEGQQISATVVAEIQRLLDGLPVRTVATADKYLTTVDIAARLGISPITAARRCASGEIEADKTSGGQWRTTEARLKRSPYLNNKRRKLNGEGNAELE